MDNAEILIQGGAALAVEAMDEWSRREIGRKTLRLARSRKKVKRTSLGGIDWDRRDEIWLTNTT